MMAGVLTDAVLGVLPMSSRSVIGRRDMYWRVLCVVADAHTVRDIDPKDPKNMFALLALDRTQAAPQSFCLNDDANENM